MGENNWLPQTSRSKIASSRRYKFDTEFFNTKTIREIP